MDFEIDEACIHTSSMLEGRNIHPLFINGKFIFHELFKFQSIAKRLVVQFLPLVPDQSQYLFYLLEQRNKKCFCAIDWRWKIY